MTSSESPTHPDAPRAGGETPPLDVEACVRLLESLASEGEDLYADAGAAALLSTVAAALRGIEKDRADAARWRFWRPRYLAADFDYGDPPVPVVVFRLPARFAVGADPDLTTDVLIDAARSVKPDVDVMQAEIAIYFSEVERLRASLLARHRDGERWQPATSAPKTGEHVLVTCLNEGGFGFCGGKRQDWCAVVHYWDVAGEEGFYLSSGASSPFDDYALRFTHWRPLPVMCLCDYNLADAPSVLHQPPCPLSAPPAASEPTGGASHD